MLFKLEDTQKLPGKLVKTQAAMTPPKTLIHPRLNLRICILANLKVLLGVVWGLRWAAHFLRQQQLTSHHTHLTKDMGHKKKGKGDRMGPRRVGGSVQSKLGISKRHKRNTAKWGEEIKRGCERLLVMDWVFVSLPKKKFIFLRPNPNVAVFGDGPPRK